MSVWKIICWKILFFSTVWKEISKSVSIVWYELWKECLLLFDNNSLKIWVLANAYKSHVKW